MRQPTPVDDVMDEFPPERMDVIAGAMMSAGASIVSYVGVMVGVSAAEQIVPPDPAPTGSGTAGAKHTSYAGAVWRTIKQFAHEHTLALGVAIPASVIMPGVQYAAGAYTLWQAYKRWKEENKLEGPVDLAKKAAEAGLREMVRYERYLAVGVALVSAGGAWWIFRHPEIMIAAITTVGEVAKTAVNEVSEVIDAFTRMIPGISGLVTALGAI